LGFIRVVVVLLEDLPRYDIGAINSRKPRKNVDDLTLPTIAKPVANVLHVSSASGGPECKTNHRASEE